jgi:stage II sporulation protein D
MIPFPSAALFAVFLATLLAMGCGHVPYRNETAKGVGSLELAVVVAEGSRAASKAWGGYRGRLVENRDGGRTILVNHVSIEDYVKGVLPGEVPTGWSPAALETMAIVARTYAWYRWQTRAGDKFQLMSDTRDQQYCGLRCETDKSNRAVESTTGLVLVFKGEVVPAYYHSCCAGATEDIREVWGGGLVRPLGGGRCGMCSKSSHYGPWTYLISRAALARKLASEIGGAGNVWGIRTEGTTSSGRVKNVVVSAGERTYKLSGAKFRSLVGFNDLRSAMFSVRTSGDDVEFKGTGWGHGVGLCQEGAGAMAAQGYTSRQILQRYFPGAEIRRLKK